MCRVSATTCPLCGATSLLLEEVREERAKMASPFARIIAQLVVRSGSSAARPPARPPARRFRLGLVSSWAAFFAVERAYSPELSSRLTRRRCRVSGWRLRAYVAPKQRVDLPGPVCVLFAFLPQMLARERWRAPRRCPGRAKCQRERPCRYLICQRMR
jgi:hypothetical protein